MICTCTSFIQSFVPKGDVEKVGGALTLTTSHRGGEFLFKGIRGFSSIFLNVVQSGKKNINA